MKDRSVVEIIVLMLTFVVGIVIIGLSAGLIFVEIRDPETDTTILATTLMSLISAILGTLFGMLISKGDKINGRHKDKEDDT